MPHASDLIQRRGRLLAELPASDPRILGRRGGRLAHVSMGTATVALAAAARQLPGLARPQEEAAAGKDAVALLHATGAVPLALLQSHRLGGSEAPGMEGRVQALRRAALAEGLPCMGGTLDAHPSRDALLQTHAFAIGLGAPLPAYDEATEAEEPLPEGRAPWTGAEIPPPADLRPEAFEGVLHRVLKDPALADPAPLCGPAPEGRAALVPLPGTSMALAWASADAAAWTPTDPFWAAAHAVAAAARKAACVGAEPLALAVALALGPEDEAQAWTLQQALAGLRQASLALELPVAALEVVSCPPGVREAPLAAPCVAVLGAIEDHAGPVDLSAPDAKGLMVPGHRSCGKSWRAPFESLFLLGEPQDHPGGSVFLDRAGGLPELRLDEELRLQRGLREGIGLGLIRSARDLAEGGLLGAVVDAALAAGQACQLFLSREGMRLDALLFGEAPGRVLVGIGAEGESALRTLCGTHRVPLRKVGVAGGRRITVAVDGAPLMDADLEDLGRSRASALEPWLG